MAEMRFLVIFGAKYLFLLPVAVFFLILARARDKLGYLLKLSVLTFPLSLLVGKLLNHFIQDPRPFVVERITPLIAHAPDNGFPSDHTLLTATIAAVVFVYNKKIGILLFILSFLIGAARVLAGLHHPLDVAGSFFIGVSTTWLVASVLRRSSQEG